jgi:hypothetical protein
MPALVECHAGYRYAQRPVAFSWLGERKLVEAVLDQWLTPESAVSNAPISDLVYYDIEPMNGGYP